MNNTLTRKPAKRLRPLVILDGKRLRYVTFSMDFGWLRGCVLSWTDKAGLAYSDKGKPESIRYIVHRSGRWIILLNTSSTPKNTWKLQNIVARYEETVNE